MSDDELDLTAATEDAVRGDDTPKGRGGRPRTNSKRTDEDRAKDRERYHRKRQSKTTGKQTTEVESRMGRVIDRIAERQEGRGDTEIAGVLREDGQMMTSTVADAVKLIPAIGQPLLLLLGLVEPFLAFGRLGGILRRRLLERRAAQAPDEIPVDEFGRPVDEHGNVIVTTQPTVEPFV